VPAISEDYQTSRRAIVGHLDHLLRDLEQE
jgi:hypothetical protein